MFHTYVVAESGTVVDFDRASFLMDRELLEASIAARDHERNHARAGTASPMTHSGSGNTIASCISRSTTNISLPMSFRAGINQRRRCRKS